MLIVTLVAAAVSLASGTLGALAFATSSPPRHRPRHAAHRNPYAAPTGDMP